MFFIRDHFQHCTQMSQGFSVLLASIDWHCLVAKGV